MQDSKLIQLFRSFQPKEVKQFIVFIESPYFNTNEKLKKIAKVLLGFYPDFDKKLPPEEKIFELALQGEEYDYFKFRNFISDILELALQFITWQELDKNDAFKKYSLIKSLRLHHQDKLFEREAEKIKKQFNEPHIIEENDLLLRYWVAGEELSFYNETAPNTRHDLVQKAEDAVTYFYMIRMLDFYSLMLHEKIQNNVEYTLHLYEAVTQFAENEKYKNDFRTELFRLLIRIVSDRVTEENYFKVKEILFTHHKQFNEGLKFRVSVHLVDFCAYHINTSGQDKFIYEVNELHKFFIVAGIMKRDNLPYMDFLNVIKVATRAGDFEFAETYIQDFISAVDPADREDCLDFSYAFIAYYKKDFALALQHMAKVNFKNHIMKIQVKLFTIRFLYEQRLFEQINPQLDAFAHYLKREAKLPEEIIHAHEIFVATMRECIRILFEPDKKIRKELLQKLLHVVENEPANYFGIKNWFKTKIETEINNL